MDRIITIKGKAEISVSPDLTTVDFPVREKDKKYKNAYEKLQKKTAEIFKCVNAVGIDTENIKTLHYSSYVDSSYERKKNGNLLKVDNGYVCSQTIQIKFGTDSLMLGNLINEINENIENPDISISFSIKDKKSYEEELVRKLTEDAKSKATIFCELSGAKLGKLISVEYLRGGFSNIFSSRIMDSMNNTCKLPPLCPPSPGVRAQNIGTDPVKTFIPNDIVPEEKIIEENALFVWEITDNK